MYCCVVAYQLYANCSRLNQLSKREEKKNESFVVLYIRLSIVTIFTFDMVQLDNYNFQPLHIVNDFSLISEQIHDGILLKFSFQID